jgi:type VI secretion system protein VasD
MQAPIIGERFAPVVAYGQLLLAARLRLVEAGLALTHSRRRSLPLNQPCLKLFIERNILFNPSMDPTMTSRPAPISTVLCTLCLLTACAGSGNGGSLAGAALEAAGLRKPAPLPEAQLSPRKVVLRLHAAKRLNVDRRGQPLALLVRVYKLRQQAAFEQAPYAAFQSAQAERDALGADLIEVKEVTLVPGQQLELADKLTRDAAWLGVVALFHTPGRDGWRVDFAAADLESAGATVGLHACAMSVGSGAPAGGPGVKPLSLVRCQ